MTVPVFHLKAYVKYFLKLFLCCFFNCDLNRGCLVYMFFLRFSGSKFLINLRRQFHVRTIFSVYVKIFVHKLSRVQSFYFVFKITISKMIKGTLMQI